MILLSTLGVIRHLICGDKRELAARLETDPQDTVDWARKWLVDFEAYKTYFALFD